MILSVFCYCRYWNDPEVLSKLSDVIGFALPPGMPFNTEPGDAEPGDAKAQEETGDEEDELTIHFAASVGDVEVFSLTILFIIPCIC